MKVGRAIGMGAWGDPYWDPSLYSIGSYGRTLATLGPAPVAVSGRFDAISEDAVPISEFIKVGRKIKCHKKDRGKKVCRSR